jgi:hypothetical protein
MDDPLPYRVVIRARNKPGVGYSFIITRNDLPGWSNGTSVYYASPEAAAEAGRIALAAFLARRRLA